MTPVAANRVSPIRLSLWVGAAGVNTLGPVPRSRSVLTVDSLADTLQKHQLRGRRIPVDAAVAAVLRQRAAGPEILFIRRAKHPRDPWSGHMGWPGGRVDPEDPDPRATSVRETREELALDLERSGEYLGRLSTVSTHLPRFMGPRGVAPYVFRLRPRARPRLRLNHEVDEAVYIPLRFFFDSSNRSSLVWAGRGLYPCYRYEGRVVWGLTLKMLDELMALWRL